MNPLLKGALTGLLPAVLVDLHAWTKSEKEDDNDLPPFKWRLAIGRGLAGAISGVIATLGISAMEG